MSKKHEPLTENQKVGYYRIISELRAQPTNRSMPEARIKRIENALVKLGFTREEINQAWVQYGQ